MSSPHSPPAFSRSLKVFKSQLSIRDAKAFEVETLNDLRIAVEGVQREQAHRRGYRNLNKIKPLVDFLHQYARVIEQFVSAKPDFLAFIWVSRLPDFRPSTKIYQGPIKFCIQVALFTLVHSKLSAANMPCTGGFPSDRCI